MDALAQIDDVTERHDGSGRPAVDGMGLEIAPGEAMAVTGPSGGGRPTLPNLIADLARPASGTIAAAGRRSRPSSPKRSASKVWLRAGRDRLILDAYSVGASGGQIGRAISTESACVVVWRDRDRRSDRRNGGITALRRWYRQPLIPGPRPDLKQRVQATRRRRRLPSEAQEALVNHADRRTGGD
jgi:energy-coupling factor transporter ATP-binding protein EcfA2